MRTNTTNYDAMPTREKIICQRRNGGPAHRVREEGKKEARNRIRNARKADRYVWSE